MQPFKGAETARQHCKKTEPCPLRSVTVQILEVKTRCQVMERFQFLNRLGAFFISGVLDVCLVNLICHSVESVAQSLTLRTRLVGTQV